MEIHGNPHQRWIFMTAIGVIIGVVVVIALILLVAGIRVVRPTHRGLVERFGRYNRYAEPGLH